jgi:uncharacterized protein
VFLSGEKFLTTNLPAGRQGSSKGYTKVHKGISEKGTFMEQRLREFQVFAKPVGSTCNLQCSYCYYLKKKSLYPETVHFHMDDDILEKYIVQHIEASTETVIAFSWHGGEPLMAGIEFYKKVLALESFHKPANKVILNGIQTNGTLINEQWSRFFADNGFLIGISIDGPAELHDIYRRTKDGGATAYKAISGIKLLKKHGIIPELLCVVNSENVRHPLIIYNFFKQLGAKYMTFLPLVERDPSAATGVSKNTVPSEEFGYFLRNLFEEWVAKDIGDIKIQVIEEAARTAFNQDHTLCIFKENCGGVPVVEHNGDFYSCDHFVDKDHLLGNIQDQSLAFFLDSKIQTEFGRNKSVSLPDFCIKCEVRSMCNGECPKNRFILTPDGSPGLNYLCKGYQYFFNHIRPFVEAIAKEWSNPGA